jgi:hypothetical protein
VVLDGTKIVLDLGKVKCTYCILEAWPLAQYIHFIMPTFPSETDQLNRGFCEVKAGSNVCPEGLDFQINTSDNPPYTQYHTRCSGDL